MHNETTKALYEFYELEDKNDFFPAYLYLKSATLTDVTAMDPWAQTARYSAAKALAEAGLLEDARQIYSGLLRATRDTSRKAVLQNEIQRLHLVSSAKQKGS